MRRSCRPRHFAATSATLPQRRTPCLCSKVAAWRITLALPGFPGTTSLSATHSALSDRHRPQVGHHDRPRYRASRVACVSLVYMPSPLPRHSDWEHCFAHFPPAISAFPERVVGSACATFISRIAQRSLTLRPAHSPSHLVTLYTEGFSHFVTSMTAPIASGWSKIAGWDSHSLEKPPLHGAHPTETSIVKVVDKSDSDVSLLTHINNPSYEVLLLIIRISQAGIIEFSED